MPPIRDSWTRESRRVFNLGLGNNYVKSESVMGLSRVCEKKIPRTQQSCSEQMEIWSKKNWLVCVEPLREFLKKIVLRELQTGAKRQI